MQLFVDLCRNIGATPMLMTQASLVHTSNSAEERKRIGFHYQKLTHDALVKAYEDCNGVIRAVSAGKGVKLIDLDAMLTAQMQYFSDHVHLTPAGGQRVAEIVSEALANELSQVRKGFYVGRVKNTGRNHYSENKRLED